MKYIIANWKANKNIDQVKDWIDLFLKNDFNRIKNKIQIIICPPFPFIYLLKKMIVETGHAPSLPIKIGAQDLSQFESGTYTGEVTAKTLSGLINYVIIGHSERRKHFNENTKALFEKFVLAKKNRIEPLFCIRNEKDPLPLQIKFVVYEPVYAISNGTGQGNNEPLEKVLRIRKILKLANSVQFIYGGSVNDENATYYLKAGEIDGVLVGGASLNPDKFYKIVSCV